MHLSSIHIALFPSLTTAALLFTVFTRSPASFAVPRLPATATFVSSVFTEQRAKKAVGRRSAG